MARRGLWYRLEKCLSSRNDWNRIFLRWECSWKELNRFLEKRDCDKEGRDRDSRRYFHK